MTMCICLNSLFLVNYVSIQWKANITIGTVKICLSTPSFRGFFKPLRHMKSFMFINIHFKIRKKNEQFASLLRFE